MSLQRESIQMNTDFKEYFSTRNGKNLANGASLFKFTFHLRRERRVFCLSEESDLVQCHCSIMHAYIYMYDNTLGGGAPDDVFTEH